MKLPQKHGYEHVATVQRRVFTAAAAPALCSHERMLAEDWAIHRGVDPRDIAVTVSTSGAQQYIHVFEKQHKFSGPVAGEKRFFAFDQSFVLTGLPHDPRPRSFQDRRAATSFLRLIGQGRKFASDVRLYEFHNHQWMHVTL